MYDIEKLLDDVKAILVTKLNAKIADISAEKASEANTLATPLLDTVEGIFFHTWDDKILNHSPAILYGLRSSEVDGSGLSNAAEKVTIFIEVYYTNPMNEISDAAGTRRMLRYMRALKEVLQENFDNNELRSKIKIKTFTPMSFRLDESSDDIKVGGVEVETSLV